MNPNPTKKILLFGISLLLIIGAAGYWYFFMQGSSILGVTDTPTKPTFEPFGRTPTGSQPSQPNNEFTDPTSTSTTPFVKIPALRLLSNAPVGGYGASTTASTTAVRWIDRGRGNVYEARSNSLSITAISNTILPQTYSSLWNKNLTAFIGSLLESGAEKSTTIYTEIKPQITSITAATGTPAGAGTRAPFELKGKNLPANIITYAISPKKDQVFMLINESGIAVGYVATFAGTSITRIFDTPVTQLIAEWPEDNTIALTTNGTADQGGFLYFVNPKTGIWKKILGPVAGLSAKVSRDAKYVSASFSGNDRGIFMSIYTVATGNIIESPLRTLAEKCVWGSFYKNMLYCGVPTQRDTASYPDDWYKGKVSFADSLWQMNVTSEEVTSISSLLEQADRFIDAANLQLDDRDDFLFFINKTDLSLWSLDLVSSN